MSVQPPFAATADFKSLPPPPLKDHNLRVESVLRPSYTILSLAELNGSPYLLSGDSKGFISAWDVASTNRRTEDPEHYFEAHSAAVTAVILLQSGRLPELVEEYEWPRGDAGAKRQAFHIGEKRVPTDGEESTAPGEPTSPGTEDTGEPGLVEWEDDEPPPKSWCCCLSKKFSCCGEHGMFGPGRRKDKHWLIATASEDGTVRVWRWRLVPTRRRGRANAEAVPFEVDFITEWASDGDLPIIGCSELYDGHLVVALQGTSDVLIIDPGASIVKWVLYGHTGPITALTQCADGRLVTGAEDGAVRLWARNTWDDEKPDDPTAPALAWADPEEEMPRSGVSSMAFFAHTQQAQKGEYVTVTTRIFVERAENLPKADLFSASDPYVTCTIVDGVPGITESRTPARRSMKWGYHTTLTLRKHLMDSKWQIPESAVLDFEVYAESRLFGQPTCLAHWAIPVDTVLNDIQRDPMEASQPQPRKLYAPVGEGPHQDLKDAALFVGFMRSSEHTLDCIIDSAEGLIIAGRRRCYVRVRIRNSTAAGSDQRRVTSQTRLRTSTIDNNLNPVWNEVLEIKVPACQLESRFVYGPDLYLHLEVFDADVMKTDDLLGTLAVPFQRALREEGQGVQPYEIELAQAFRRKAGQKDKLPVLHLGFDTLTPCPLQLRCYVERATSLLPCMGPTSSPIVRIRCVESNPLVPQMTTYRTETKLRSTNPHWNELCVLPLPKWHWKNAMSLRPASVRASWEHEADAPEVIICAEVFDHDIIGTDVSLGRCVVSLSTAVQIARDGKKPAVPFPLSGLSGFGPTQVPAVLYLGFEPAHTDGEIVVRIEKAERLPTAGDISADPYCVVKVSERGAFGQPADLVEVKSQPEHATGDPANLSQTDPVWQHEELLDLPGSCVDDLIAVRPNWFIHFDVVDMDEGLRKEASLMQAIIPISEVLTALAEAGRPSPSPTIIQSRIDTLRGATTNKNLYEMAEEATPPYVVRDMPLVESIAPGGRPQKGAAIDRASSSPSRSANSPSNSSSRVRSPSGGRMQGFMRSVSNLGSTILSNSSSSRSNKERKDTSPKGLRDAAAGDTYPGSGNQTGDGLGIELGKGTGNSSRLIVHFQAIPRWQGASRDRKKPLPRPLKKPSPVTTLTALGSRIIAGYENGNVYVWDATDVSPVPLHQFEAHRVPVSGIAYLAPLDCIVTTALSRTREEAGSESLIRLWSVTSLELRQTISLHSASTRRVLSLTCEVDAKKGSPCLALATETRQSKLIQILTLNKE